jgi:hypothetical protein
MSQNYKLLEVNNKKSQKLFLNCPSTIYKNDLNWVRYLDNDINKIFNPKENKLFRNGEAIRWVLLDNKKVIGRIAAFYNKKTSATNEQPTGGIGFFDCINNQKAADFLFNVSMIWLKDKGMEAMDGPINFGSRENFWGCLKEGFYEPVFNMPYNFKYYNDLFENYGFKNYFNQYTYHLKIKADNISPKFAVNAEKLTKDKDISFGFHDKKNPDKTENNFIEVFNAAWAKFPGVSPMSKKQAEILFNSMKQIIDPRLFIFAYHKERPIAFFIMIPDINPIIKKFNGKLHLINKLRLLYDLKIAKVSNRALGLIFGVIPEFQGKYITDGMINHFNKEISKGIEYTDLEMNWIGDFNLSMIKLVRDLNAEIKKVHVTYRYLFDREKEFKRAKRI